MTFCDDFAQRLYTQVMRVRIKLLIFYWLDKERESKKKKLKKMCQSFQIFWLRKERIETGLQTRPESRNWPLPKTRPRPRPQPPFL